MLHNRFSLLIEKHADELAEGLVHKLQHSPRTESYRSVPTDRLKHQLAEIYRNLSIWLTEKTEEEIQHRYTELGKRRAEHGIPAPEFVWSLITSKEHLWNFLLRESMAERASELMSELEFLMLLEQFFDRAIYYGLSAHDRQRQMMEEEAA